MGLNAMDGGFMNRRCETSKAMHYCSGKFLHESDCVNHGWDDCAEYSFGSRVTEKIDIYSFGVVLLELVTGKRAADASGVDGTNLVQWVHSRVVEPKRLCEIIDSKCGMSSQSEMIQVLKIAILCTNDMPSKRPSMREVVKSLGDMAQKSDMMADSRKDAGSEEGFDELDVVVKN